MKAIVDSSLEEGIILCQKWDVATERRRRRIKTMDGEISIDAGLSAIKEMKRVLKEAVDRLFQEMNGRLVRLNEIDEKFGFLLEIKGLI